MNASRPLVTLPSQRLTVLLQRQPSGVHAASSQYARRGAEGVRARVAETRREPLTLGAAAHLVDEGRQLVRAAAEGWRVAPLQVVSAVPGARPT
jgi:hypothetical protein